MSTRSRLRDILLTKLDRILNPDFNKKYIWGLFALGVVCVGVPRAIGLGAIIEWKYKDFFIKISVGDTTTTFLTFFGAACVFLSAFLFYKKLKQDEAPEEPVIIEYEDVEFDKDDKLHKRRTVRIIVPKDSDEMITRVLEKVLDRRDDIKDDEGE